MRGLSPDPKNINFQNSWKLELSVNINMKTVHREPEQNEIGIFTVLLESKVVFLFKSFLVITVNQKRQTINRKRSIVKVNGKR